MNVRSLPLVAALLLAAAAAHAAETRTVLVRGRVVDASGWPLRDLPIAITGSRTAETVTDAQGRYGLYLTIPTPAEIARQPFAVQFEPRREGWLFARAGGGGLPAVEIRIVGAPARAVVRAPDEPFAHAVATVLGGRVALVMADLDLAGWRSDSAAAGPAEMPAMVEVPVRGVRAQPPRVASRPAAPAPPVAAKPAPAPRTAAKPAPTASTPPAAANPAPATPAPATRVAPAPAPSRAAAGATRSRADSIADAQRAARARAAFLERVRRDSIDAVRKTGRALAKAARATQRRLERAREDSIQQARRTAQVSATLRARARADSARAAEVARRVATERRAKARQDSVMAAWRTRRDSAYAAQRAEFEARARAWKARQDSIAASKPGASRMAGSAAPRTVAAAPPRTAPPPVKAATPPAATSRTASKGPATPRAPIPPAGAPGSTAPRTDPARAPVSAPAPAAASRAPASNPAAAPAESLRAAAPRPAVRHAAPTLDDFAVTRVEPPDPPTAPAPPAIREPQPAAARNADGCGCVIRGTVEARSERRIPEYLRVTLWLADALSVRDSVELFMGSPRAFELHAPCGDHRLDMLVEPRLTRYRPRPAEAFRAFGCGPERPTQWRIVLHVK